MLVLGLGLAGGWAVLVPLSAAVTIPGTLVLESSVKKIQYPAGGVVAEIRAHDGMRVNEGDLLVRLDETQLRANMQVIADQLDEARVRIARLTAERDGSEAPKMSGQAAAQPGGQDGRPRPETPRPTASARARVRVAQQHQLRKRLTVLMPINSRSA